MNLRNVRELFREMSGRYDLVNDDLSDHGADEYINEAVRWLDRKTDVNRSWGTQPYWVPQGTWIMQFPTARAVRTVRINDEPVCVIPPSSILSEINRLQGRLPVAFPCSCAIVASRKINLLDEENNDKPIPAESFRKIFTAMEILPDTQDEVNTVIFNGSTPVADAMITLTGTFYQPKLIEDDDENYWTRNYHMLLINAVIRQVHVTTGNKALLDIMNAALDADIVTFGLDIVDEAIYGSNQMRSNY